MVESATRTRKPGQFEQQSLPTYHVIHPVRTLGLLARVLFLGASVCVVDDGEGVGLVVMLVGEAPVLERVEFMVLVFNGKLT